MIKSDLMNRKFWLCLFVLLLLSGCGRRPEPDLEHFQGEVVATLQKQVGEVAPEVMDTPLPPSGDAEGTPEASQPIPTNTPVGTPSPTSVGSQSTDYPVTTATATRTPVPSTTTSLSQTPTSTFDVSAWQGAWKIWFQTSNGGYKLSELTVQVNSTVLRGTAKIDGVDYTFKGDIFMEGTQVEGEWQTASNTGTFWWRKNSADTFVGSRENRFGFCGNRATAVQPNPCREVRQN